MYRRGYALLAMLAAISAVMMVPAFAAGYEPSVNTADYIGGIIYHQNGTISYGPANGTLAVMDPAPTSPLSAVNITLVNGSVLFIDHIGPAAGYSIGYDIAHGDVRMPLALKETITPSSLFHGGQQQVRLCVQIENTGNGNITGFEYQKALPTGLTTAWTAHDGGVLSANTSILWTIDTILPGEKKNMSIAFNLTPTSDVHFPEAYIWFGSNASLAWGSPGISAGTTTAFHIQKTHLSDGTWQANASVPDDSELNIYLSAVSIDRSDAADPFNVTRIASYAPGVTLNPGCDWKASVIDDFANVPAYFIRISYSIPYTLDRNVYLKDPARTDPITIAVAPPAPTATYWPTSPYATPTPTAAPSPSPSPIVEPDIVFVTPGHGDVIRDNTTDIVTSVPPSDDPGYVVYYGSTDNKTWTRLGESAISGNMSDLTWTVPRMNGTYYLKAEHYNTLGLRGIAFTQVLLAHEILPVGMTTMLMSGTDWLMLFLALVSLLLLAFIFLPYLPGKPVIYDSSALRAISSRDKDWLSKLSRRAIRPDEFIVDIEGVDRIRMKALRDIDAMRRLERDYGLPVYDAMALQLAKEVKAVLYTADPRVADIGKKLDIDVKTMEKIELAIER